METEIKQRQDTNQHNAMANDTTENKTKEKNKLELQSCSLARLTPYTPSEFGHIKQHICLQEDEDV